MARIRSIKPEFCLSEQVNNCSHSARLLFITMWCFCDDGGNHPAKPMQLKAECFPADDIGREEIGNLIGELISEGLLVEFEADGNLYWHVTGWSHQKIDKPSLKYPKYSDFKPPMKSTRSGADPSTNATDRSGEHSDTIRRPFDEESRLACARKEWRGEERSREEKEGSGEEKENNTSVEVAPLTRGRSGEVDEVVRHWQKVHPRAVAGAKERKLIAARLKDGYAAADLCEAIDGMHKTPHNLGHNDRNTKYLTLEIAMRDSSQVSRFIANNRDPPPLSESKVTRAARSAIDDFVRSG